MSMPAAHKSDSTLLRQIARHCMENLQCDETAKAYLRANGITAESVWRQYRLGNGSERTADEIGRGALRRAGLYLHNGINRLCGSGVRIPTFDPRDPKQPIGILSVREALNRTAFITEPAGAVCPETLADEAKIVLCDAPLNALRLAQMGCPGVLIAIDPERTLPPLQEWLRTRNVVLASTQQKRLDALAAVLGLAAEKVLLPWAVQKASSETLAMLGLEQMASSPDPQRPVPTQSQIAGLVRFAQERLANGQGHDALREHGIEDAEFIQTYALGYLPGDYRAALSAEAREVWKDQRLQGTLIAPAFDEQGVPVDFMVLGESKVCGSLFDVPRGLVAPKIATAFTEVYVTESLKTAIKMFASGQRNVLILRNPDNARQNAVRLKAAGVQRATLAMRHGGEETAQILSDAGIAADFGKLPPNAVTDDPPVTEAQRNATTDSTASADMFAAETETEPPRESDETAHRPPPAEAETPILIPPFESAPQNTANTRVDAASEIAVPVETAPPCTAIVLVSFDPRTEQAVFKAGDATHTVEAGLDGQTRMALRLERAGNIHVDRFDLASEAQRRRFAASAALKVKLPCEQIETHLVAILEELRRMQNQLIEPDAATAHAAVLSEEDRNAALAALKRPELLEHIAADLAALGWSGEDEAKRLLYLTAISRKLPSPLSAVRIAASGAGKSYGLELLAELTPPEDLIHVSRLTDSALYYQNRDGLRHKLLLIDEACALTPEALTALRILQTRGALSQSYVQRDPNGGTVTQFAEAKGPVAVLTSTVGKLNEQNLSRCFTVPVDESPEQTRRVLEAQRRLRSDSKGQAGRDDILRRHRNLQRMIECRSVVIPFASQIEFPATSVKHRREQERFLNLIEASALLHQHQRLRDGEFIVADKRDFEIASRLAADSIARAGDELTPAARDVLSLIATAKLATFSMDDLKALRPDWTRYRFRYGLDELLRLEIVTTPQRGRGALRQYTVRPGMAAMLGAERVQLAKLAAVGGFGAANLKTNVAGA